MAAKEVDQGKYICQEGQSLDAIHIIVSGSVKAKFSGGEIVLKKGDVVGLCDIAYDSHFFNYITMEPSSFVSFAIKDKNSLIAITKANPEVGKMIYTSMINQVCLILANYARGKEACINQFKRVSEGYNQYVDFCMHNNVISRSLPSLDDFTPLNLEDDVADWILPYYVSIRDFPQEIKHNLSARVGYLNGFAIQASLDIHSAFSACAQMADYRHECNEMLMQDSGLDLFDLYTSLLFRLKPGTPDSDAVLKIIEEMIDFIKDEEIVDPNLISQRVADYRYRLQGYNTKEAAAEEGSPVVTDANLTGSLDTILEYSGVSAEVANTFKRLISQYKKVSDKASSEDDVRKLRLDITKYFYQIYTEAFQMSIRDYQLPTILKMFFNFGYVDEELAGAENANYLLSIADSFTGNPDKGVYTAYEWLRTIYSMDKDPSRNEFDADYIAYLHDQKIAGKISLEQEKQMTNDPGERVMFELQNMFPSVNKMTYGRISSFCPVFSEHDCIKPLQNCIVTQDIIEESIKKLETIDYGAYYREIIYTNEACGVSKEFVNVRVTPDFVLMPNIGTRGVMWQEIEGRKRTTPARYMVSVFHLEDLPTTITRLTGEYRWEMCKRVQGARWNDVSDRSLTSEYFDYIQFYKKNSELSADAKEKIKTSLSKAKNSFKEMFVRDYITWVLFEGAGAPRLNKLVRTIMCTYCPFPKALRDKVSANPMFKDIIERYDIKTSQKLHHYDNVITKIKSCGQTVPAELLAERDFIEGSV